MRNKNVKSNFSERNTIAGQPLAPAACLSVTPSMSLPLDNATSLISIKYSQLMLTVGWPRSCSGCLEDYLLACFYNMTQRYPETLNYDVFRWSVLEFETSASECIATKHSLRYSECNLFFYPSVQDTDLSSVRRKFWVSPYVKMI